MKLLVVDNDRDMVEMLTGWLKGRGYEVQYAFTADKAKALWIEHQPDLVILDTSLRDADALAMCRDMRCKHDALVLALTSDRDVRTEINCLESGADGYLMKPFFPMQLLAHIHALTRRVRTTLERRPSSVISVGPIRVDSLRNEVVAHGKTVRLTPTESKVLHMLAVNANDVCTLEQIVTHVWGFGDAGDTYLIKAHIRHLREKIERDPSTPKHIITVPGVGYMMRRVVEETVPASAPANEEHFPFANMDELDEFRPASATPAREPVVALAGASRRGA